MNAAFDCVTFDFSKCLSYKAPTGACVFFPERCENTQAPACGFVATTVKCGVYLKQIYAICICRAHLKVKSVTLLTADAVSSHVDLMSLAELR